MSRGSSRGVVLTVALAGGFIGCEDDPVIPTGNLIQPAGMVYVARPELSEEVGGYTLQRADVLIADAESQGVRIAQYATDLDREGNLVGLGPFFAPAPVAFFKLAAEAPGLPTRVVASPPEADPRVAFVLAPAEDAIHVLEVEDTAYAAPATTPTNVRVGGTQDASGRPGGLRALLEVVEDPSRLPPALVPVDLAYLGLRGDEHWLAVGFDGLGHPGRVVVLAMSAGPDFFAPTRVVASATTAPGFSDLVWDARRSRILAASVAEPTLLELTLDLEAERPAVLRSRTTPVGNRLTRLVLTEELGLLGMALAEPAVVWMPFDEARGAFRRSSRRLASPYDRELDAAPGILRTRSSPVLAAAAARSTRFALPSGEVAFDGTDAFDVMVLAHADGRVSFVHGTEDRVPVIAVDVEAPAVVDAEVSDLVPGGGGPLLDLDRSGCEGPVPPAAGQCVPDEDEGGGLAYCEDADLQVRVLAGQVEALELRPFGRLVHGFGAPVDALSVGDGRLALTLSDARFPSYDQFLVRPGDAARVTLLASGCAAAPGTVGQELEGVVVATSTDPDPRFDRARVDVSLDFDSSGPLGQCTDAELAAITRVRKYELHVPDGTPEVVVAGTNGEVAVEVYERTPLQVRTTGSASVAVAEIGGVAPDASSVGLTLVSAPLDDPLGALACTVRVSSTSSIAGQPLDRCLSETDCTPGRTCAGAGGGCRGACSAECAGASCLEGETARVCPVLRLELRLRSPLVLDLRSAGETDVTEVFSANLPADAIHHPLRQSFLVSYPGSGTMIEVPFGAPGRPLIRTD